MQLVGYCQCSNKNNLSMGTLIALKKRFHYFLYIDKPLLARFLKNRPELIYIAS